MSSSADTSSFATETTLDPHEAFDGSSQRSDDTTPSAESGIDAPAVSGLADQGAEAAQALGELQGTLQLADTVTKASEAALGYSETDPAANLAVLTELHELKETEITLPEGASAELVQAADAVQSMTEQAPDPAAAVLANEHFSVPSSSIGRSIGAAILDRSADGLVEAYGDKAQDVADKIHALTAVIREGGDDKAVQEAYGEARKELNDLIKDLSRGAVEAVAKDEAVAPALEKLEAQSEKTAANMSAQELEAASAGDLGKAGGPADPTLSGAEGPEGHLPPQAAVDNLREVLGASAQGLSDGQLTQAMGEGFAERAQELGITKDDVDAAMSELKDEAVREGRDPATIDEAVAVAALVERENALDKADAELGPQTLDAEISSGESERVAGSEQVTREASEHQAAEHEAEMEMGVRG